VHVTVAVPGSTESIRDAIRRILRESAGVDHATIEVEVQGGLPCPMEGEHP